MQLVVLANGPPDPNPFGDFVMTRGKTSPPLGMLIEYLYMVEEEADSHNNSSFGGPPRTSIYA